MKIRNVLWLAGVLGLLFGPPAVHAEGFDYSGNFGARTVPQGASITGTAGYSKLFWGDPSHPTNYGYLKPFLQLSTSGVVNRAGVGFDAFPIAIAGFTFSYAGTRRDIDTKKINCSAVECRGTTGKLLLRFQSVFGYDRFFFIGRTSLEYQRLYAGDRPFIDEQTVLIADRSGDRLVNHELILGAKISETIKLGSLIFLTRMIGSGNKSDQVSLFSNMKFSENWSSTIGFGAYHSDYYRRALTAFLLVTYNGISSMGYF